jgi:hypothetical protein
MKTTMTSLGILSLITTLSSAGTIIQDTSSPVSSGFEKARRPISNPTLFDLALPTTNLHPIFLHHRLPSSITKTTPGNLPIGGDVQLYALQFEIAMNERLSIVATKDGYVDFNPNSTLTKSSGFANLGAGAKYAFLLDPASQTAVSGTMTFELPTGNSDVLQGEGKGAVNLILNGLKLVDDWQFAAAAGAQIPFSDEQSTNGFISTHASYEVCSWFIPLVELNWFHVIDAGNGTGNFAGQAGGGVPGLIDFEGGDLFNLGAVNAGDNRDLVTAAIGFRSRLTDSATLGVAYEIPLTDDESSLMKDRITLDLVWTF